MTTYVLDVATWRCGSTSNNLKNKMGLSHTRMVNAQGYSCCLGQFAMQKLRKKGKSRKEVASLLAKNIAPSLLAAEIHVNYDEEFVIALTNSYIPYTDTKLATQCIRINDDLKTTVREKIKKLRAVLKQHGHTLRVLNQHLIP